MKQKYDRKRHLSKPDGKNEVKYLNSLLRRGVQGIEWECDSKLARTLMREYGMAYCKGKGTPLAKDGPEKSGAGELQEGERARKVRRGISFVNYMAQDRPYMAVTARVLSPRTSTPTDGSEHCLKRAIRDRASHPHGVLTYPRGSIGDALRIWTDSD